MRKSTIYLVRSGDGLDGSISSSREGEGGFSFAGCFGMLPSNVESSKVEFVLGWYKELFGAELVDEDEITRVDDGEVCYVKSTEHPARLMTDARQRDFDSIWSLLASGNDV